MVSVPGLLTTDQVQLRVRLMRMCSYVYAVIAIAVGSGIAAFLAQDGLPELEASVILFASAPFAIFYARWRSNRFEEIALRRTER